MRRPVSFVLALLAAVSACPVSAQSASGFVDHGVPVPVANARGVVSTVDGQGRDVVLSWLQDHRGGYSLLMVDALTGRSSQFPIDFRRAVTGAAGGQAAAASAEPDEPFAVHLSSRNRFYTVFGQHLVEFDVAAAQLVTHRLPGRAGSRTAMSLTEDRQGRVWAATYPDNSLFSYEVAEDPAAGRLVLQGTLGRENWAQYPRSVAADSHGWIYVGVGMRASQLYAFHPGDGLRRRLLPEAERLRATAEVVQTAGDVVFARNGEQRYELLDGRIRKRLPAGTRPAASAVLTGAQNLVHRSFPSGRRLESFDLQRRELVTRDAAGQTQQVSFRYETDGAALTHVCATDAGQVCGGARFPMALFRFDPSAGRDGFQYRSLPRQPNVIVAHGERLYVGGYPGGSLFELPLEPVEGAEDLRRLAAVAPRINRPHALVVQAGEGQVIMGGTPEYGHTGGGLLFWRRGARDGSVIHTMPHQQLVPGHSTQSLLLLADGRLLGGTTRQAGTGGEAGGAPSAMLYLLDPASAEPRVLWSGTPVPGATEITDLVQGDDGLVHGIAGSRWLFRFDPQSRRLVGGVVNFGRRLGASVFAQGTRAFVRVPATAGRQGGIYVLLLDGIARLDPASPRLLERVASSPVEITAGGAHADGRIYFAAGSHLYSWQLP